jgi:flagellar hook-associated protein 2
VVVSLLATQGTLYTEAVKDGDTSVLPANAQTADLKIQIGGANGPQRDIPISSGTNDTLNKIVSYINSQNWGVTAMVLSDASGARLAIYSQSTGTTGAMTVLNNTTGLTFNDPIGGTDASFTVDGISFDSTTNTVTGAIPGVTLNLLGAFPGIPAQLSVGADTTQAAQAISDFVSAYNAVIGDLNQQFTVDPSTHSEGPLAGDNVLRALQSNLLANVGYSPANGTLFTKAIQDGNTSILPTGVQSADIQLQIGSSGPTHDITISAGTNDTLNSLASYINKQGWGLTASVINGASGSRLSISNNSSTIGAVTASANSTNLTFFAPVESAYGNLNSLGITMNNDGTLSLNAGDLKSALATDPSGVLNFFQNTSLTGFANNLAADLQNLTDPTPGMINLDLSQNQQQQLDLTTTITNFQDQMSAQQKQLLKEFSQVNALIEEFPFLMQSIDLQLGITPSGSSNTTPAGG